MSVFSKLASKTQRTLTNTDIMAVQDAAGASWYKISLTALRAFLYDSMLAVANTWTAIQTFTLGIDVNSSKITRLSAGTTDTDAVNKGQMDTADGLLLPKSGGTMTGRINMGNNKITGLAAAVSSGDAMRFDEAIKKSTTLNALNIPELVTAPSSSSDTIGSIGDFGWKGQDLYLKSTVGWVIQRFSTF